MLSLPGVLDPHTLFLGGLVVHATFMLTLALLAWSDRRTRGMRWLAAAGALQFLSTAFRLWRGFGDPLNWDIPGSVLLLGTVMLMYLGLRWFSVRRALGSLRWPLTLALFTLLSVLLGFIAPRLAMTMIRCETVAVLGVTIAMLWQTHLMALRRIARLVAVFSAVIAVLILARLAVVLQLGPLDHTVFSIYAREATLVAVTLLEFSFVAIFVAESNRRLHEETRLDVLTGLRNRRSIEETASRELSIATASGRPLALLMLDLDHFKALNDTWGHALGDRALRAVGGVLLNVVGASECVARLGGEEFAVLLPGCSMEEATLIAERLRTTVEGLRLAENGSTASLTVSIGVSCLRNGERSWESLLERADVALYRAKREGRNRVTPCAAEPDSLIQPARINAWRKFFAGRGPLL